jgi:hypothetical protein
VACNGCTDDTAAIARASGHPVRVLDLEEAGKPAALRAGEHALGDVFPRLYLDADVIITGTVATAVLGRLATDGAVAARPPFRYDTSHSSALVRRYYRARAAVPAVMGSIWGAGVYGLSAAGRARFGEYPDVVAEDLFVDQHMGAGDVAIVGDDAVIVVAPARYGDLLRFMRRSYRGAAGDTSVAAYDDGSRPGTSSTLRDVVRLGRRGPAGVLDALTYAFVAVTARAYVAFGRSTRWERDDSSRVPSQIA